MMWLLVLIALQSNPLYPHEEVLSIQPTEAACEEFKLLALKETLNRYHVTYPLNFQLVCKKEKL